MIICGAYAFAPYLNGKNLVLFFVHSTTAVIVCGAYAFASYLNGKNLAPFFVHSTTAVIVCGAYAIRPYTDTRKNGDFPFPRIKTNPKPDEFSSVRVGAYCIRPTNGHANGRTNRKMDMIFIIRVGAY